LPRLPPGPLKGARVPGQGRQRTSIVEPVISAGTGALVGPRTVALSKTRSDRPTDSAWKSRSRIVPDPLNVPEERTRDSPTARPAGRAGFTEARKIGCRDRPSSAGPVRAPTYCRTPGSN